MPAHALATNAAWLQVVLIACGLPAWAKALCPDDELARAEPKRLCYCLWHTAAHGLPRRSANPTASRRHLALREPAHQRIHPYRAPRPADLNRPPAAPPATATRVASRDNPSHDLPPLGNTRPGFDRLTAPNQHCPVPLPPNPLNQLLQYLG